MQLNERDAELLTRCALDEQLPKSQIVRQAIRAYADARGIPLPRKRRRPAANTKAYVAGAE